jgi:hypothetical protein
MKDKFCTEHKEWAFLHPYMNDRPSQPWTLLKITDHKKKKDKKDKKENNEKKVASKSVKQHPHQEKKHHKLSRKLRIK